MDQLAKRSFWTPLWTGVAVSMGLHALLVAITGLYPRHGDIFIQWFTWFVIASALPLFALVVIGGILAPLRSRLGPLGIGMMLGAVASPPLWAAAASAYRIT